MTTVPSEVRLDRHTLDLDDDGHDINAPGNMAPTLIGPGQVFWVPADRQCLFAETIEVDPAGELDVDGMLIEVDASGGGALLIKDEGANLDAAVASIDFTGAGATASVVGHAVTVNVPGGGSILGATSYANTTTDTSVTGITGPTDIDASLAITFTVPASGKVLCTVSATLIAVSGTAYFIVREGSTTLKKAIVTQYTGGYLGQTYQFLITGLTPGSSKTFKPGVDTTSSANVIHGPTYGAVTFKIEAAP